RLTAAFALALVAVSVLGLVAERSDLARAGISPSSSNVANVGTGFTASPTPAATAIPTASLSLGTTASPPTICALGSLNCGASAAATRVTLTAQVTAAAKAYWPDVQIAFVIETTGPDGDEDHYNSYYGTDPCASASSGQGPLCEEANGVPFIIA